MTKCPVTGAVIATGIEIDVESFDLMPPVVARVYCPYCKIEHYWQKKDAWIDEDGDEKPRDR